MLHVAQTMMFKIRSSARSLLLAILVGSVLARATGMIISLQTDDERALLAFPLTVIVPATLSALLIGMPPAKSREGLLMRLGTIIQLLLIIIFPAISLYLALGLPVVFLVVELFETQAPLRLRTALGNVLMVTR